MFGLFNTGPPFCAQIMQSIAVIWKLINRTTWTTWTTGETSHQLWVADHFLKKNKKLDADVVVPVLKLGLVFFTWQSMPLLHVSAIILQHAPNIWHYSLSYAGPLWSICNTKEWVAGVVLLLAVELRTIIGARGFCMLARSDIVDEQHHIVVRIYIYTYIYICTRYICICVFVTRLAGNSYQMILKNN